MVQRKMPVCLHNKLLKQGLMVVRRLSTIFGYGFPAGDECTAGLFFEHINTLFITCKVSNFCCE